MARKISRMLKRMMCFEKKTSVERLRNKQGPRRVFLTPECSTIRDVISGLLPPDFLDLTTFDVDVSNELMSMEAITKIYDLHCSDYFNVKKSIDVYTRILVCSNRKYVVKAVLDISKCQIRA